MIEYFLIYYNRTGKGHTQTCGPYSAETTEHTSFEIALDTFKKLNPKLDIDEFWAFFIAPCDENGYLKYRGDDSKREGWNNGGNTSYPSGR